MDFTHEKRRKIAKWVIEIAAVCIVIFLGLQNIGLVTGVLSKGLSLIMPLILGFAFALILNVPMSFFEKHLFSKTKKNSLKKLRRPLSFVISVLLIAAIVVGVVWLVIPELVDAFKVIADGVINFIDTLRGMSEEELATLPFGNQFLNIDWDKIKDSMQSWLKRESGSIVNSAVGTVSSLVGGIFDFFVAFVFSIYILFGKEKLKKQASRLIRVWLPKGFAEWFIHASSVACTNFHSFVSGQSLEAVILGTLCMIGMLILRIPYAPMVGALIGVTALIPEKKAEQEEYRKYFRRSYNKKWTDYICVKPNGDLITPNYITSFFPKFLASKGLRKMHFRDLRHTCATLMQMNDIGLNYIKEYLGHSDISTTANTYSHLDLKAMQKPVDKMESIIKI